MSKTTDSVHDPNDHYPFLLVLPPHTQEEPYSLKFGDVIPQDNRGSALVITLGRGDHNHIALPDPEKQLSRLQCRFVWRNRGWWIEDSKPSANGTYVRRDGETSDRDVRDQPVLLQEGDEILILGAWADEDTPLFWHLIWSDPGQTRAHPRFQRTVLEYSSRQQKLYRRLEQQREVIPLRPKELRLVEYLASRYESSQQDPEPCSSKELIPIIWEEEDAYKRTPQEVNHLICHVRKKIEPDMGEPRWLLTMPSGGYILKVRVVD